MKISILTIPHHFGIPQIGHFYPLFKWRKQFKKENIDFNYFTNHKDPEISECDAVMIDSRYLREQVIHKKNYEDNTFIKRFMEDLKNNNTKVLFLDNSDASGCRYFDLIDYTDKYIAKQLFKDRKKHSMNEGAFSYRPFLKDYRLTESMEKQFLNDNYDPCPEDQLYKLKTGWNIGMYDYRYFPFSRYYPVEKQRLFNRIYSLPKFYNVVHNKNLYSSFRGKIDSNSHMYSFQRNCVIELFQNLNREKFVTGGIIGKKAYLDELKRSKICVSPFGYGEVCYRDFEAIQNGCVLLKPSMEHIDTFPNIFLKNKTYIELNWDMSDLQNTLQEVIENYESYIDLMVNAQMQLKDYYTDPNIFVNHTMNILN